MLYNIFFSAKGTTEICAACIGRGLNMEMKPCNWFDMPCNEPLEISSDDVLLFSMPVYGGFIPQVCAHMAKNLKGDYTPAVIAAVYGNRHYDDALLQMKDILTEQGFVVIAAGAFLAEHSVFPSVASGRPDARDKAAMEDFAAKCCSLLKKKDIKEYGEIMLPGTPGYDGFSYEGVPFKPCGDEKCIGCGACVKICPQKAICAENPCQTDEERCIACGACIKACPTGARNYHSELYEQVRADFEKLCAEYRTPETFYAEEAVLMKKIPLATPTMHGEEQKYIQEAFDTNWVSPLGPNVDAFEREIAAYAGASASSALSSGTAALHLSVILAGVKEEDIVFIPSLTFAASVNPVRYEKAVPVFIDSERDTWNMDPAALRKAFEKYPHPAAVMAVHLYGTSAEMDEICSICKEYQVPLIEDAAESLGTTYRGKMTGTFGDYGIYSFNGNKIITTSSGGILVAKKEEDVEKARFLSSQARDPARHYQHSTIGYNYRMSNIVAGIGRGQMLHINDHIEKKQRIYRRYKEAFADIAEIEMNPLNRNGIDNNWLSCMTVAPGSSVTPVQIMDALAAEGIETRPIWKPMHLQPIFEEYDFIQVEKGLSVSEDIFNRGLCLPSDSNFNAGYL